MLEWTMRFFGGGKVTRLQSYRKKVVTGQRCSLCRKRADKLMFYSMGDGKAAGACRACRPRLERQGYLPL